MQIMICLHDIHLFAENRTQLTLFFDMGISKLWPEPFLPDSRTKALEMSWSKAGDAISLVVLAPHASRSVTIPLDGSSAMFDVEATLAIQRKAFISTSRLVKISTVACTNEFSETPEIIECLVPSLSTNRRQRW